MTIKEAIDLTDRLKPNQYGDAEKVSWLSELDGRIWRETILTHERDTTAADFKGYAESVDMDTELLIPWPYDTIYRWYLEMMIDDANGETAKYNNSAAKYNTYLQEYKNLYNRENAPLQENAKFTT
jgi:hypothetical protein